MNRQQEERMKNQRIMAMNKSKVMADKQERDIQLQKVQAIRVEKVTLNRQKIALLRDEKDKIRKNIVLLKEVEYKTRKGSVSKLLCVVPCVDVKTGGSPVYKADVKVNPQIKIDYKSDISVNPKLRISREEPVEKQQKELARALISEMVKDEIITAGSLEWFGITDREFIVNGIKQPADILEKYKAKYLTHPGMGLFYGPVKMTGTGFFIGKGDL
jgi:hypothetical protein